MIAKNSATSLRSLYFVRFAFQLVWAVTVIVTSHGHPFVAEVLLVLYPLWDVACTVYEMRQPSASRGAQVVNCVLGLAAAMGIASTVFTHETYALAAFGVWALVAGVLQLAKALARRKQLGGQWAQILSGAQSTVAGIAYVALGLAGKKHVKDVAGYAIFGAVYFLISGIFLARQVEKGAKGSVIAEVR